MQIYFVTNICPHYRVKAFELIANAYPTRFFFFSDGEREKYWDKKNTTSLGNFDGQYVKSWRLFTSRFRFIPFLYAHLLFDHYDVLIKCINGKAPLLLSFLIAKLRGKPFILWSGVWYHPKTLIHRISFPLLRWIYLQSHAIVVYGTHVKNYLTSLGIPSDKIFIAWQTVDNERLGRKIVDTEIMELRKQLGITDEKVVLYVGRLESQKGIEYLIRAMSLLSSAVKATLVFIGVGSRRNEFEQLLYQLGIPSFRFLDHIPNNNLPSYYRLADVLVLPSITTKDFREPWGLVVNEAMNQGCPVIATDAVGAAVGGLLDHGRNGIVVPERSEDELAANLSAVLLNENVRIRLSSNAKTTIGNWTYERMVSGFRQAIDYVFDHE